MPASPNAIFIARAGLWPVGSGSVTCFASRRDAVAEELGVDLRAACLRVLERLEHDDRPGLAHDEAVTFCVERARAALRVVVAARARIAEKPAIPIGVIGASVPPASITSARPSLIASSGSPIAMFEAAHAVHCDDSGPFVPSSIDTQAAPMFGMIAGIENGLTRSGPR